MRRQRLLGWGIPSAGPQRRSRSRVTPGRTKMLANLGWSVLLCSFAGAFAQTPLPNAPAVAEQLGRAQQQLLLVTPTLLSKPVAEAVRRAVAERGVEVFIVTSQALVAAPGSFAMSLALLPGVQIRLSETERRFALVDTGAAAFGVEGLLISEAQRGFNARPTFAFAAPAEVQDRAAIFQTLWSAATPYRPFTEEAQ